MAKELNTLLAFFIIGILIGIIFDIFRVLRKTFKTANIITYIEDFLFWILTGLLVIYGCINIASGEVRLYMILMIIIGIIIYFMIISKAFIFINYKILSGIKFVIETIFKFIKRGVIGIFTYSKKMFNRK